MKTRLKKRARPDAGDRRAKLGRQISAARVQADSLRGESDAAKVELKRARKAFKAAKKIAKEARRKLKALKQELRAVRPVRSKSKVASNRSTSKAVKPTAARKRNVEPSARIAVRSGLPSKAGVELRPGDTIPTFENPPSAPPDSGDTPAPPPEFGTEPTITPWGR